MNTNERNSQIREAEQKAAGWLHWGNLASERGEKAKAERHYERAQKWHDRMNELIAERTAFDYDYANDPTIQRIIGAGYAAGRWSAGPTR